MLNLCFFLFLKFKNFEFKLNKNKILHYYNYKKNQASVNMICFDVVEFKN